jgi:hypothetical protein
MNDLIQTDLIQTDLIQNNTAENNTTSVDLIADKEGNQNAPDPVQQLVAMNLGIIPAVEPLISPTFSHNQPPPIQQTDQSLFNGSPKYEIDLSHNQDTQMLRQPSNSAISEPQFDQCEFNLNVNIQKMRVTGPPPNINAPTIGTTPSSAAHSSTVPSSTAPSNTTPSQQRDYLSIDTLLNQQNDQ